MSIIVVQSFQELMHKTKFIQCFYSTNIFNMSELSAKCVRHLSKFAACRNLALNQSECGLHACLDVTKTGCDSKCLI